MYTYEYICTIWKHVKIIYFFIIIIIIYYFYASSWINYNEIVSSKIL